MSNSPVVHLCQEALAKDLHINASDVRVVSVEAGQWPDSGLGMHKPYEKIFTLFFNISNQSLFQAA